MPLKVSSNSTGTWITWEKPDESVSTTYRLKTKMTDEEILKTLVRAVTFISREMGLLQAEIAQLELEIMGTPPGGETASVTLTPASAPAPTATAPSASPIPMMPPASLSDRPADGGPVTTFGWDSMPTTTVPQHLQQAWEIIPPGEA